VIEQVLNSDRFVYLPFSCYIRRRKQMMYSKHDFTMTYTPGLNVTYDEDETKPAGMNCIHTEQTTGDYFFLSPLFART